MHANFSNARRRAALERLDLIMRSDVQTSGSDVKRELKNINLPGTGVSLLDILSDGLVVQCSAIRDFTRGPGGEMDLAMEIRADGVFITEVVLNIHESGEDLDDDEIDLDDIDIDDFDGHDGDEH